MNKIPYYTPKGNLKDQIEASSSRRKISKVSFLVAKFNNWFYASIAWNCPINTLRVWCHRKRGVNIGKGVMLGFRCTLDHAYPSLITLEDNSALAGNVYLIAHSNPYKHFKGKLLSYTSPVIIRRGAWVGVNATILPGVEIGINAVVSAGAVISENVADNTIVAGNPGRVIRVFPKL